MGVATWDWQEVHSQKWRDNCRLAMRKRAIRIKQLVDLRVCGMCKYAFISRRGHNICSQCISDRAPVFRNMRRKPSVRRSIVIMQKQGFPEWLREDSMKPAIPVPSSILETPFFQMALQDVLRKMGESYETQSWIVHQMPRLDYPPFPYLQFEGFVQGRLGRKGKRLPLELQIERGLRNGA